jgi:hypothetical protein
VHALLNAFAAIDHEHSTLYSDVVLAALPAALRRHLEDLMISRTYEYQSDFVRRFVSQGGAEAVLEVLDARGIEVSDDARHHITECTDPRQIQTWARRAATAMSIDDLFE